MKNKHLVRQFQIHMLITVALIVLLAVGTFVGIEGRQKEILPDKTSVYIDVTSSYADGRSETDTYKIDLDKTDQSKTYEKKNPVEVEENSSEVITDEDDFILISLDEKGEFEASINSDSAEKVLLDKSKIQMGTNIAVSSIRNGFSMLSKKEQATYTKLEYLKYGLPAAYFLFGILISCYLFYILRIKKPLLVMEDATDKISNNNLDFVIESKSKNELGRLCDSLECMRATLTANNTEMFKMMHEKRKLQSSVAHDLRNPIAIMKGYLEMLDLDIKQDEISKEELDDSVSTLLKTVERMEEYVESVNSLNHLEELELLGESVQIAECFENWKKDLQVLGEQNNISIEMKMNCSHEQKQGEYILDTKAISRVLENIVSNSCRYARETIEVTLFLNKPDEIEFVIFDDGPGYPDKLIKNPDLYFFTTEQNAGHIGMGLTICRILCAKHNGGIEISNAVSGGAVTKIKLNNIMDS